MSDATPKCMYCGESFHKTVCPLIKSIEYEGSGFAIKRVEFHPRTTAQSDILEEIRDTLKEVLAHIRVRA